ncbi:PREDICTED: interleukin-1 receptor-associated kinase 4-like isoform X1 [Branchiostoma belcheri]|uniref:non-specific serine/threonine protein kinase n=2 Tax=Branchiostoma belcheri TaxID=7741 RepID=A0A6P4ZH44_BRABE|nr:PREDICTED: interleukin-1 receptor-associated kinase 4-like isoform X1 [Branchiostoma belcheri]
MLFTTMGSLTNMPVKEEMSETMPPPLLDPKMYIRKMPYTVLKMVAMELDPPGQLKGWRDLACLITKGHGSSEPRYNVTKMNMFDMEYMKRDGSPTIALLQDWGTQNTTVQELVEVLLQGEFYRVANMLIPGSAPTEDTALIATEGTAPLNVSEQPTLPQEPLSPRTPTQSDWPGETRPGEESSYVVQYELASSSTNAESPVQESPGGSKGGVQEFRYSELQMITNSFNGNKLGEGAFGTVYKGTLTSSTVVAVKRLKKPSDQMTAHASKAFRQEISVLSRFSHENLVPLIGYSIDNTQHPCLVYLYMENGSLQDRLSCKDGKPPLTWLARLAIAQGTAAGICHLHEHEYVHRDIKSANILLDRNNTAKVGDFGLVRVVPSEATSQLTTTVFGTSVYMAPEAMRGEVSPKLDTYSFGVVLLELITGRPGWKENEKDLVSWKEDVCDDDDDILPHADPQAGEPTPSLITALFTLSNQCLEYKKKDRPEMITVKKNLDCI